MGIRFQMVNPRICCRSRLLSCRDLPSSPLRLSSSQNPSFDFDFSRRWHFGHRPGEEGEKIFRLGLTADIGLSVAKALTGYLCGSTAIIADAAHSVSDVVILICFVFRERSDDDPFVLFLTFIII